MEITQEGKLTWKASKSILKKIRKFLRTQRHRHSNVVTLRESFQELELYRKNHKKEIEAGDHHDPTALELFCEVEPDADECRVYED